MKTTYWSFVGKTVEQGGWTGVCRFDRALRSIIPDLHSITELPELDPKNVVITDNHLSLRVPPGVHTIVVHHGCAATHYERDPHWQTEATRKLVQDQGEMFLLPNRVYVAPSAWVVDEFRRQYGLGEAYQPVLIPNWSLEMMRLPARRVKPRIIGDWRDWNKGATVWRELASACPEYDFAPLDFKGNAGLCNTYCREADAYLCLSVSEGGAYSVADAEAAGLPLVTTDVGNYREFRGCEVIPWQKRDDAETVRSALQRVLSKPRPPSFYAKYNFNTWAHRWKQAVRLAKHDRPPVCVTSA